MNKIFGSIEWFQNNISRLIQWIIYAVVIAGIITGLPTIIKSCNSEPDYETINANFIEEKAKLHGENFSIQVLDAITVSKITIKDEKSSEETIEKEGNYVAVTVKIRQNSNSTEAHTLDNNDFKLKDHTGTLVPIGDILDLIDVTAPDFRSDSGDSINSNASFSTRKAIKDYTWVGTSISKEQATVITLYFEIDSDLSVENTIMILEVDFYTGFGETNSATDIVLFKRKEPIT